LLLSWFEMAARSTWSAESGDLVLVDLMMATTATERANILAELAQGDLQMEADGDVEWVPAIRNLLTTVGTSNIVGEHCLGCGTIES
jgi:hypothetical protein